MHLLPGIPGLIALDRVLYPSHKPFPPGLHSQNDLMMAITKVLICYKKDWLDGQTSLASLGEERLEIIIRSFKRKQNLSWYVLQLWACSIFRLRRTIGSVLQSLQPTSEMQSGWHIMITAYNNSSTPPGSHPSCLTLAVLWGGGGGQGAVPKPQEAQPAPCFATPGQWQPCSSCTRTAPHACTCACRFRASLTDGMSWHGLPNASTSAASLRHYRAEEKWQYSRTKHVLVFRTMMACLSRARRHGPPYSLPPHHHHHLTAALPACRWARVGAVTQGSCKACLGTWPVHAACSRHNEYLSTPAGLCHVRSRQCLPGTYVNCVVWSRGCGKPYMCEGQASSAAPGHVGGNCWVPGAGRVLPLSRTGYALASWSMRGTLNAQTQLQSLHGHRMSVDCVAVRYGQLPHARARMLACSAPRATPMRHDGRCNERGRRACVSGPCSGWPHTFSCVARSGIQEMKVMVMARALQGRAA